jgi:hypothetical protein
MSSDKIRSATEHWKCESEEFMMQIKRLMDKQHKSFKDEVK